MTHAEEIIKNLCLRIIEMDLGTRAALGMAHEVAHEIMQVCETSSREENYGK